MKPKIILIIVAIFLLKPLTSPASLPPDSESLKMLTEIRHGFYQAVEDKKVVDSTLVYIDRFYHLFPEYEYYAVSYIGALLALKGKHAFLPTNKYKWVKRGLKELDRAVELAPENMEVRFIRGSICFYLPFFFKRKQMAKDDFKVILTILSKNSWDMDPVLLKNMLNFIKENLDLTPEDLAKIKILQQGFAQNE